MSSPVLFQCISSHMCRTWLWPGLQHAKKLARRRQTELWLGTPHMNTPSPSSIVCFSTYPRRYATLQSRIIATYCSPSLSRNCSRHSAAYAFVTKDAPNVKGTASTDTERNPAHHNAVTPYTPKHYCHTMHSSFRQ